MNALDWSLIALYLSGMIGLSIALGRGQSDQEDYYVGGRKMPWWAVGTSTMATQTSAISFISIPAFVALKPGGGLTWLQYELAVPLAMILVTVFLLPFFRKLELISVYEYLELRFGSAVRSLISGVFLVSRALGTGVGLYASAIVLNVALDTPFWMTILMMGGITIAYDTIGGIKAVVWSDVIQMLLLLFGILLCIGFAAERAGGLGETLASLPPERWATIDLSTGLGDGSSAPFWGFLVGGFFLYASYYGTDQSQVQRELSAASPDDTRKSLLLNGFARFPLTLLYLLMGIAVGAAYLNSPELRAAVPSDHLDYLVPEFIVQELPVGVRAILVAAILAAAMSSLDSSINSLSAVTMRDFVEKGRKLTPRRILFLSKVTTVFWGVAITGFAFLVGGIADTIIESINKIGSAFYGPILASFLVGLLSARTTEAGVLAGVLAGVVCNLYLWLAQPEIFWMWWNLTGLVVAILVSILVSLASAAPEPARVQPYTLTGSGFLRQERRWIRSNVLLLIYFFFILTFTVALHLLAR